MKTYYAELHFDDKSVDLHRFHTKSDRDLFVEVKKDANTITLKEAKKIHKEQFKYWK